MTRLTVEIDPAVLASLSQRAQEAIQKLQQEFVVEDALRLLDEMSRDYERFLYESWLNRFRQVQP